MNSVKYFLVAVFFAFSNLFSQSINDLIPKNEAFFIQSMQEYGRSDKGYWDIPGGEENIREKAQIKIWQLGDAQKDRRYVIENSTTPGYVKIHIEGVAGYLDIEGGNNNNGAKLIIYGPNTGWNQNYTFKYLGGGKFKIYSQNGKVVCLSGRSSENGTALNMWDDHDGPWMEWALISTRTKKPLILDEQINAAKKNSGQNMNGVKTVYIQSALSYGKNLGGYFDVPGVNYPATGNNLQLWELGDFGADRRYEIVTSSSDLSYYSICVAGNPNIVVDVANAGNADGTNIGLCKRNNNTAQNFTFKHLGNGRFKIYSQNGKVVCTGREPKNGTNIHIWTDHEGPWMEWYLIDSETNRPFIPADAVQNINSIPINSNAAETKNICTEIDNTYNKINNIEGQSSNVLSGIKNSYGTLSKCYSIINTVNTLNSRVNDTESALSPFGKFPVIGPLVKILGTTLKLSLSQIGKANTVLQTMRGPVLDKSNENVSYALLKNLVLNSQLNYLKGYLLDAKRNLADLTSKNDAAGTVAAISVLKQKLITINSSINSVDKNISEIEKVCDKMKKMDNPVKEFDNGLNSFDNGFSKVDKVADEINDVLNKRFKKKIGKVGVDISLRDILSGGKVGKLFDKYVNGFIEAAFKPLLKKLDIKIPGIPSIDKVKDTLNEGLDFTKKVRENSEVIEKASIDIANGGF